MFRNTFWRYVDGRKYPPILLEIDQKTGEVVMGRGFVISVKWYMLWVLHEVERRPLELSQ